MQRRLKITKINGLKFYLFTNWRTGELCWNNIKIYIKNFCIKILTFRTVQQRLDIIKVLFIHHVINVLK